MKIEYIISAVILILGALGLAFLFTTPSPTPSDISMSDGSGQTQYEQYKEIVNPAGFVNAENVVIGDLIGKKVILIDFLTYSCINCQRTFPYINSWYEEYKDQGLEVIGIHTPEFAFEKDINNVQEAMAKFGITHPIVLDNDYATWRAYGNQYWPRKYLIDIHGNIIYDHIGEGGYAETEMKIREALAERAEFLGLADGGMDTALVSNSIQETNNFARSPETYFGSLRNEYLKNGTPGKNGVQQFIAPTALERNALFLDGSWNITPEYAETVAGASIFFQYSAKEVYIVAESDSPSVIEVWQDGVRIGEFGGADVSEDGKVTVSESALYKLVNNKEPGEHILQIKVKGKEVRFYAFTFG